jgi:hypothetical protein
MPHTFRNEICLGLGNVKSSALKLPHPRTRITAIRTRDARRISVIIGDEALYAQTKLVKITNALNLLCFSFGL